jgi:energy-coupling factor transporter transmembrane protein EcfT
LLASYHHEVDQLTQNYVSALTLDELGRIVDDSWQPPVSVAVRLISVLGDTTQHVGQAAYVRGLAERAGR